MTLVLTLRGRPEQRLDLAPLVPHLLAGKSELEIAGLELQTTRARVTVGEAFRIRMGDPAEVRIAGACDRLDRVGCGMTGGAIVVEGDVGVQAGRLMVGGRLTIIGGAGPWAASGMRGGVLEIAGAAGDLLGGPLAGETAGMRGGVVVVRGDTGERTGDRLRRGTIIVEGAAGAHAASRMLAGTLIVCGACGAGAGYLMRRGTVVLGAAPGGLPATFADCGTHELVATRLMAGFVREYSRVAAALLSRPLTRYAGDMAVAGKGEILLAMPD